jgi:uncharacterized protein (DUF342 family)
VEIARGKLPEDGLDGKLEFYVQPSSEEARYAKDATGRVNYHELNLIENVQPDQEVARILPPKPGSEGSTVLGELIAPQTGEPAHARAGKGIRMGPQGDSFLADTAGRLVYADDILSVSQDYEVKGNVDYSVGNVDFVGRVIVHGEVLDEFDVRAEMGLEVRGPVGNCKLTSGADMHLASGMNGRTRGQVKVAGTLRAKYINEATVEAGAGVHVEREAYNAIVRTSGAYLAPTGKVVGGEVVALRGIEVGTAGSDLGVATKLVAGVDYRRSERLRHLNEELARLDKEIERVGTALGPVLVDPKKLTALPPEKKKVVLTLVSHLKVLKEKREAASAQLSSGGAGEAGAVRQINVKEKLYAGVTVEVGSCRLLVKTTATGPLTLAEDIAGGTVRILPYAALGGSLEDPGAASAPAGAPGR